METKLNGRILAGASTDREYNSQLLYFTCSSLSADD